MAAETTPSREGRLPFWLRKRIPAPARGAEVARLIADLGLQTVCFSARCPNLCECYARGTATFLALGPRCTRACRFCAVESGQPALPRAEEPIAIAEACSRLGLAHVVVTMVTRDDLEDGGAAHIAAVVREVRARLPQAVVEVLTSDFAGDLSSVETVLAAGCDVFNHNLETVERLYRDVRSGADYRRSLNLLSYASRRAAESNGRPMVKSGMMVGLGETDDEVLQAMGDLRAAGCQILTLGQYLAPSVSHAPVTRFVEPHQFEGWREAGLGMGFLAVSAGPFVRSSYLADSLYESIAKGR